MQIVTLRKILGLSTSAWLLISSSAWAASDVLDYTIRWNTADERYYVYMKPTTTPTPDSSMTGQVTILVPHHDSDDDRFQENGLASHISGVNWARNSRTDAPTENPGFDYLSFTFTASRANAFGWQAGEEREVFSFTNSGACLGPVALLDNENDPFVIPVNNGANNSSGTNPGNQFSNIGWSDVVGDNNYRGNYGAAADCQDSLDVDGDGLNAAEEGCLVLIQIVLIRMVTVFLMALRPAMILLIR